MARLALGKGLSALIREPEPEVKIAPPAPSSSGSLEVDIDLIDPNPFQPRTSFREQALEELAQSIRSTGVIQPIVLRRTGARYQLIAGERRWRAAQRAGLHRIAAVIRDVPEELALEMTLVENLQREDLNPVEQARAFERLMAEFHLTQEDVAVRTGKDRTTIANAVRLLMLDAPIIEMLEDGRLTAGHGRALLAIHERSLRIMLADQAARKWLSVRQLERLSSRQARSPKKTVGWSAVDANTRAALEELQRDLGTRVLFRPLTGKHPGRLILEFYDNAQLISLYERLRAR
ncbi:MAG TPA: ParB/RepB/Spo0J family partition protein [Candidatus Acidoferrum sp.]|nr:ParB/RepB/Spo0J family partition protein [Candidatus Acidoferrum sp.]